MKKIISLTLAVIMTIGIFPVFASAEGEKTLQFDSDGKFKIMIFADVQDFDPLVETTVQLMNECLDKAEPDLVVYLGDTSVAVGDENEYKTVKAAVKPCVDRDIPFAVVFGNHDGERETSKEQLLEWFQEFGCLTTDADPDLYGCGNSNLTIKSSDGKKTAFNLWFFDSNSSNPDKEVGGYDTIHKDQVEWYKKTAAELKEANGGETVPSILFQHIIMTEIYERLYPKMPLVSFKDYTMNGVSYFPVPFFNRHSGIILEPCSPSFNSEGQWDAIVETGDVIATFYGHDHVNDFRAEQDLFMGDSFEAIVGYGPHAAIVHYGATPETNVALEPRGFVLVDSGGQSVIGGGHTGGAAEKFDLADRFAYVSTGGGALETFLLGEPLPVVEALRYSYKNL